jgi:hypothetical protein
MAGEGGSGATFKDVLQAIAVTGKSAAMAAASEDEDDE